jgi:hypothetical protein
MDSYKGWNIKDMAEVTELVREYIEELVLNELNPSLED